MQIIFIKFLFAVLASWRICHLLSDEDGPWYVIFKIRKQLGQGFFGSLLECFYCLSIWVAIPFALWLSDNLKDGIVSWLAISGGACIIYKASSKK
jgi:Protein of unknown function (DUF1360)